MHGQDGAVGRTCQQIEGRTGVRPGEALADGGFAEHQDMEQAQQQGTTV